MKGEIGGYFELELNRCKDKSFLHSDGALLNSGKTALEYILRHIQNIKKIWISYYTCDTVLIPIEKLGLKYEFYRLDEKLEITRDFKLSTDEYVLYHNYFGIKDKYIQNLYEQYGEYLIVDYAQSYNSPYIPNAKAIYSPRKSYGVPDGGVAYPNYGTDDYEQDFSNERFFHLLKRYELPAIEGYYEFKKNSEVLRTQPIKKMSKLTFDLLSNIEYDKSIGIRFDNFMQLHNALRETNILFKLCDVNLVSTPAFYPYYSEDENLRKYLIENKIFVATYWPNVMEWLCNEPESLEYKYAKYILPLPIDQRYGEREMQYIIDLINN